jgi:hypothetical protein
MDLHPAQNMDPNLPYLQLWMGRFDNAVGRSNYNLPYELCYRLLTCMRVVALYCLLYNYDTLSSGQPWNTRYQRR